MNDSSKLQVTRLEEIERRGRSIPVREHLGIHAFGVNAFTPGEDGTLISDHDESGSGQEELYVVLDGSATFEIDGETFEAPAGTLVSVPPGSRRKATGKVDGFSKPSSSLVATAAFGFSDYVNIDRGEGMGCPRRIQVDAPGRMATAERTSCNAELAHTRNRKRLHVAVEPSKEARAVSDQVA